MRFLITAILLAAACPAPAQHNTTSSPAGRWDVTVSTPAGSYPDWLELVDKGGSLEGRYQPRGGSVRPLQQVTREGNHLLITLAALRGKGPAMTWDLTLSGDQLTGTQKRGDQVMGQLVAVRAPALNRRAPKAWSSPESLVDGKDLSGWEPVGTAQNNWVAEDGVLLNKTKGANLRTTRKFDDFKLHIEFNCPEQGNSGIYLRGRYEIQVEYEPVGTEDPYHSMGSIYGLLAPSVMLPRKAGQWESFDVTLVGRRVTILRNGTMTIDNQEIAGITGGALDANEGEPGPFYLQGDHTGGMKYRNITVSVPKR